jgi:hypothetical protein
MENASKEFSGKQVADMIDHQKSKYDWEFVFLGANIDMDQVGDSLNINHGDRFVFESTNVSVKHSMKMSSENIKQKRRMKRNQVQL